MPDRPISVVVPTRDRARLLADCLDALRASLRPADELIVVDSASSTAEVRDVAHAAGARYLRAAVAGTSRARNIGWKAARRDVIAFIDDDVRVDRDWARAVAGAFADPGIAFITGAIADDGGGGPVVAQMTGSVPFRLDATTAGMIGHSANLAVRRQALEHIGGFDEMLGPGVRFRAAEDLDLFDRLFASGYTGRFDPAASARHASWRRIRDYVKLQGSYGFGSGARIAKLIRADRPRAMRALRSSFGESGFRPLARAISGRERTNAVARAVRIATTTAGLAAGLAHPVRDGHIGGRRYTPFSEPASPSR